MNESFRKVAEPQQTLTDLAQGYRNLWKINQRK